MKKIVLNSKIYFGIFFLNFIGYHVLLLGMFSLGLADLSRVVTIPLRLLLSVLVVFLFTLNYKNAKTNFYTRIFFLFSIFYITKIFINYYLDETYYLPIYQLFLYYISFCFIPFIIISAQKINENHIKSIFNSFIFSGVVFSIFSIFSYGRFIGQVNRLSSMETGESTLSPLALSYSSTLAIGVLLTYFFYNKTTKKTRIILMLTIGLSIIPFFLGASRGSLLALFLPLLMLMLSRNRISSILKNAIILVILLGIIVYIGNSFENGLLVRFFNIQEDINDNSTSAIRILIWEQSFQQFLDNPLLGSSFAVKKFGSHPHNIILESLQVTGVLGFIPFVILLFKGIKISWKIFRHYAHLAWIPIIFLQALTQNLFSGAIHGASWYWVSLALLIALDRYLNLKKKKAK